MSPLRAEPLIVRTAVEPDGGGEMNFGFGEFLQAVRRRWLGASAAALVVFALVVAVFLLQPREYTAVSVLFVNPGSEHVLNEQQRLLDASPSAALVDSEVEILRSPELLDRIATKLRLEEDPEWNENLRPAGWLDYFGALSQPAASAPAADSSQVVVQALARAISVKRRAASYVIDVRATARTPEAAAALANALTEEYMGFADDIRLQVSERASGWLGQRLQELRADVQAKEGAVEQFRAQTGLLTSDGVSLTERQASDVQAAVLQARADFAEAQARYQQLQSLIAQGGNGESIAAALDSNVIRDLRQREADLTRRQTELESTLGERHPTVLTGRAELESARAQIASETQRIQMRLRSEMEVARSRLNTLEGNLGAVESRLVSDNVDLVRLNELEREAEATRTVYQDFLERHHEIADQGRMSGGDARVISTARAPTSPSSPNLLLAFALGLGAGALIWLAYVVLLDAADGAIHGGDDVRSQLGLPSLAVLPHVRKSALRLLEPTERHPPGYAAEKPMSAFAEALRTLRTSITYSDVDAEARVLAVTSSVPGEGKTTTAFSLARIAAMRGERVILVDCDLRRRSLNQLLNISPRVGLLEVLKGEADWSQVVGRDEESGAHIIAVADHGFTPLNVFGSERMRALVAELRRSYDFIILDCAPILAVAETKDIAALTDAIVLVARAGKTPVKLIRSAIAELTPLQVRIAGVALNCVDPRGEAGLDYSYGQYRAIGAGYYSE